MGDTEGFRAKRCKIRLNIENRLNFGEIKGIKNNESGYLGEKRISRKKFVSNTIFTFKIFKILYKINEIKTFLNCV